jgi:hypothetical protein
MLIFVALFLNDPQGAANSSGLHRIVLNSR